MDLPVWQKLYEAVSGDHFEIISVAEDSQGEAVAGPLFDSTNPTYRCIVDETHRISTLFGWRNVPSAVWIDEDGRIVRSNEGTYAGKHLIRKGPARVRFGNEVFADAVRDWVANGSNSELLWTSSELRENLVPLTDDLALADPTFKLGVYLKRQGFDNRAAPYFEEAQRLAPNDWNYHRQAWTFNGENFAIRKWQKKRKAQDGGQYYTPMGLPNEPQRPGAKIDFVWSPVTRRLRKLFRTLTGASGPQHRKRG
jgi:hypothetical protein